MVRSIQFARSGAGNVTVVQFLKLRQAVKLQGFMNMGNNIFPFASM